MNKKTETTKEIIGEKNETVKLKNPTNMNTTLGTHGNLMNYYL